MRDPDRRPGFALALAVQPVHNADFAPWHAAKVLCPCIIGEFWAALNRGPGP